MRSLTTTLRSSVDQAITVALDRRAAGLSVAFAAIGADFLITWLSWNVSSPSLDAMYRATNFVVDVKATVFTATALLAVAGICRIGGLSLSDIGLRGVGLAKGLGVALAIGLVTAAIVWTSSKSTGLAAAGVQRTLELGPGYSVGVALGSCSTAVQEEVLWRGLLLPQLVLWMRRRWCGRDRTAVLVAIATSSVLFGAAHLVALHQLGFAPSAMAVDLVRMSLNGVVLSTLYLATGNLWITVAVHLCHNTSVALGSPVPLANAVPIACGLVIGLARSFGLELPRKE